MSALAMILTAAMAVPADGPEKVSMEMVQGLDMRGEWQGTRRYAGSKSQIRFAGGHVDVQLQGGAVRRIDLKIIDEGEGRLRMLMHCLGMPDITYLGIYKWQGDRLIICCREKSKGRPTSSSDEASGLLILHRVKACK